MKNNQYNGYLHFYPKNFALNTFYLQIDLKHFIILHQNSPKSKIEFYNAVVYHSFIKNKNEFILTHKHDK